MFKVLSDDKTNALNLKYSGSVINTMNWIDWWYIWSGKNELLHVHKYLYIVLHCKNQAKFLSIQPDKLKLNILSQKPTNRFGKTVKVKQWHIFLTQDYLLNC